MAMGEEQSEQERHFVLDGGLNFSVGAARRWRSPSRATPSSCVRFASIPNSWPHISRPAAARRGSGGPSSMSAEREVGTVLVGGLSLHIEVVGSEYEAFTPWPIPSRP